MTCEGYWEDEQGHRTHWLKRDRPIVVDIHESVKDPFKVLIHDAVDTLDKLVGYKLFNVSEESIEGELDWNRQRGTITFSSHYTDYKQHKNNYAHTTPVRHETDEYDVAHMVSAFTEFNFETYQTAFKDNSHLFYIIALHELIHALGVFHHSSDPKSIMHAVPNANAILTKQDKFNILCEY